MHQTVRLDIGVVNPHLTCVLCGGYFIDATTITECLHSFCKKCILVYLESSKCCPICDTQVHQTKSLLNLRPDKTLQDIVYKLVPGLYKTEMKQRRDFYSLHSEEEPSSREDGGDVRDRIVFDANHKISICLKYFRASTQKPSSDNDDQKIDSQSGETETQGTSKLLLRERFLLCPAALTVNLLHKFIRAKFDLTDSNKIDLLHSEELLHEDMTLADVAFMYCWDEVNPLVLYYRINERAIISTKLKSEQIHNKNVVQADRHTVTSSGRKVKTLCYTESKVSPVRPYVQIKKRKCSGSGSTSALTKVSGKKLRTEPLQPLNVDDMPPLSEQSKEKIAKEECRSSTNSTKHRQKTKFEKRKEQNIFDVINSEKIDKDCVDCEPEVPHIAIKISKTGDTKDGWSSQPCQITNPHRISCKIRSNSESKDHHRKEIEEDSGRGSDVSSPSLLSPSSTDPSMSPPAIANIMTPPHDSPHQHYRRTNTDRSPVSPGVPRTIADHHPSQKIRAKSTSESVGRSHHNETANATAAATNKSGSNSMPNSPCHDPISKDDVDLSKTEKLHRKRSHKYGSLTVKVPDQDGKSTADAHLSNGHYASVMASIPSPENPLLMKITRQISKPNGHSLCNSGVNSADRSSSSERRSSSSSSKSMSSPPFFVPTSHSTNSSTNSEKHSNHSTAPMPSSLKADDAVFNSSDDSKRLPQSQSNEIALTGEQEKQKDKSEKTIVKNNVSAHNCENESNLPKNDKISCVKDTKDDRPSVKIKDKIEKIVIKEPQVQNILVKTPKVITENVSTNESDAESISTCCRAKPYVGKLKRSTSIVSQVMSVVADGQSSTETGKTITKPADHEKKVKATIRVVTTVPSMSSAIIKSPPPPKQSKLSSSSSVAPLKNSLDHDLQAIPGLRIPRFIPHAAWYNLPRSSCQSGMYDLGSSSSSSSCSSDHVRAGLAVCTTAMTTTTTASAAASRAQQLYDSGESHNDGPLAAIRHKTPQQVKRPVVGLHHISPQPMMIQAMRRPPMLLPIAAVDTAIKPAGPTMPALWRFPGYPPYTAPNRK